MTVSLEDEYWASQNSRSHRPAPMNGNTPDAQKYAMELREIIRRHAAYQPRSLQKFLGPSELGSPCDRQVAGKMAGLPGTNHTADPWASIVGTAIHAYLADCFDAENYRAGVWRFLTETRVWGHPNHPGTADLYDYLWRALVDHKALSEKSLGKVKAIDGPPRRYLVQILMYAAGYRNAGFDVERVMLAVWPRTKSNLSDLYVWERLHTTDDDRLLEEVFEQTEDRYVWATKLASGQCQLTDIPMTPDDDECFFCPFYRPQSAYDNGPGCPGNRIIKTSTQ